MMSIMTEMHNLHKCNYCQNSNGSQVICLVCGKHCHVTCVKDANFSMRCFPLQQYATWDIDEVCRWVEKLKFFNDLKLKHTIKKKEIDGLTLGELDKK